MVESTTHVKHLLTGRQPVGDPRGADAGSARLDRFGGVRWLAVGDAAISFDPLSSQGIMTGLYSGVNAGRAMARSLGGDPNLVEEYLRRLDGIYRAYRTNLETYYAAEGRWSDRPFWKRRAGSLGRPSDDPQRR